MPAIRPKKPASFTILVWILLLFSQQTFADSYITNGGFEGPDGVELVPPEWVAGCGYMNSPDTQPGWYNNYLRPHGGKSYIDLLYKNDGSHESVYQELRKPIPQGGCYLISIHLAKFCQDSLYGLDPFGLNHPGQLIIRGSETYSCEGGQVLAVFDQVDNCLWKEYIAIFKADITINYIYLEFAKGTSEFGNGSILIDDFSLDVTTPLPDQLIEVPFNDTTTISTSFSGSNYNWDVDGDFLPNDSSFQLVLVDHNFKIDVNYLSEDSCLIYESFLIYVDPTIPNVVTPGNKDLVNDEFTIYGLIEKASLKVYNRWGNLVYQNSDYRNDWSPDQLSDGVYYYVLYLEETRRERVGSFSVF